MDAECAWNSDDPRTATAPWQGRRRMAVRAAFTVGFRRKGGWVLGSEKDKLS